MGQDTGVLNWFYLTAKAEYFSMEGLTSLLIFRSDLPVGLFCRSTAVILLLSEKRLGPQASSASRTATGGIMEAQGSRRPIAPFGGRVS